MIKLQLACFGTGHSTLVLAVFASLLLDYVRNDAYKVQTVPKWNNWSSNVCVCVCSENHSMQSSARALSSRRTQREFNIFAGHLRARQCGSNWHEATTGYVPVFLSNWTSCALSLHTMHVNKMTAYRIVAHTTFNIVGANCKPRRKPLSRVDAAYEYRTGDS